MGTLADSPLGRKPIPGFPDPGEGALDPLFPFTGSTRPLLGRALPDTDGVDAGMLPCIGGSGSRAEVLLLVRTVAPPDVMSPTVSLIR